MKTSRTRTFRFGPGSLESLELRTWTVRRNGDARQLRGELVGTFVVDDGFGQTRVAIAERANGWTSEPAEESQLLTAARNGDEDAALDLACQLLEWALEDWGRDS
jgi:hypothetical protein